MHVVYHFGVGGLENGIVNLIDTLPAAEFRHIVIALTTCDPQFCRRIERADVEFISLHKPPGHGWRVFRRVWSIFRRYRPAIVHTRNLAALEMQLPAWAAGVPVRVHGEHGRNASDPDGTNRCHQLVRRALSPFVTHYVAVSADLQQYLTRTVGISSSRVSHICNGVDERKFHATNPQAPEFGADSGGRRIIVGTVGRLDRIKGHSLLVAAIARLLERDPKRRDQIRVQLVGDGPMRAALQHDIASRRLGDVVELRGQREDIVEVMRGFDVFVLPSLAEGISNTVLEAMASGLPVVATAVGGNMELVAAGQTGTLVPVSDPEAMAAAIAAYLDAPDLRRMHGERARDEIEARFTLSGMVESYQALYRGALSARPRSRTASSN